jgi:hypothetical protein
LLNVIFLELKNSTAALTILAPAHGCRHRLPYPSLVRADADFPSLVHADTDVPSLVHAVDNLDLMVNEQGSKDFDQKRRVK